MTGLADRKRRGCGRTSYHPVMKTSGITAALPAQDLSRAKAFYVEKVGLQALESAFLKARDGQVGLMVRDGVSQLFVYPARARSSGEFTQAVIHVTDVRAAVEEMRGRGVEFEGLADRLLSPLLSFARRVCTWPPWFLQVRCPALGLSVSVFGEGWALGSITVAPRPSRPMNARTIMAIP
jgi:hypothetical protein